jgi:uncharacterized membrane protein YfcA
MPVPGSIFLFCLLVLILAGLIQGSTGFGSGLVAVPLLLLVFEPRIVVPLVLLGTSGISLLILYDVRSHVEVKRIWSLMVAGIAGMPLGMYLLLVLDADILRVFAGVVIVASALAFLAGFKRQVRNERAAWVPIGLSSGLLSGSLSMSGPPVILFLSNQGVGKDTFRANLALYFMVMTVATAMVFYAGGLLTPEVLGLAVMLVPASLLGTLAGVKVSHRIKETVFDRVVLVFLLLLGIMAVVAGLGII